MKRLLVAMAAVVSAFALSGGADASSASYVLKASLNSHSTVPSVTDANGARATLTAKFTLAGKKSSLVWTLTFEHLSGTPTKATIYLGESGKAGSVALPLCVKCQVPSAHGAYIGPYVALPSFVKAILHRGAYVAVSTRKNPNGEIRGQITASSA